jgi:hypothetical protein
MGALTGAAALATGFLTGGPLDAYNVIGVVLGVLGTALLVAQTLSLMTERAVVRDRAERAAERERREASEVHAELNAWQNATAALLDAYLTGRRVDFQGEPVPDYVRQRLEAAFDAPPEPPEDQGPVVYPSPEPETTRAWLRDPEAAAVYVDRPPVAPPVYPELDPVAREVDQAVTHYLDEELDPHGYEADPARPWSPATERAAAVLDRVVAENTGGYPVAPAAPPVRTGTSWNAFEPVNARRPELESLAMPLAPRGEYVDPGPYATYVPPVPVSPGHWDPDATEVIGRTDPDATEVIDRVR